MNIERVHFSSKRHGVVWTARVTVDGVPLIAARSWWLERRAVRRAERFIHLMQVAVDLGNSLGADEGSDDEQ